MKIMAQAVRHALAATLFLHGSVSVAAWTQFQANSRHNGRVDETVAGNGFRPLWTISSGDYGLSGLIPGVVADNLTVYFSARGGGSSYQVLAVDIATKNEEWRRGFAPYGSQGLSAPSIGNGKVYVHQWGHSGISGGNSSQYPRVFGLNAQAGTIEFGTAHSGQWSSGSRPTVAGSQVFAAGGYYGGLDAYNALAGGMQWSAKVNQQYGWIPAADDQRVYVYMGEASASPGPPTGRLYAFNRATGSNSFTIINSDDTWTRNNSPPVVGDQNDVLAFSTTQSGVKLVSFDLAAQSVRWRTTGEFNGHLALSDGLIYAPNGIELSVFNEATGVRTGGWFAPPGEALTGNLLVTKNVVFAQTDRATYALYRDGLKHFWSAPVSGDLAFSNGVLFVSNGSSIHAFGAVPEPATLALWMIACAAYCGIGRIRSGTRRRQCCSAGVFHPRRHDRRHSLV